jgi:hypothetical protein
MFPPDYRHFCAQTTLVWHLYSCLKLGCLLITAGLARTSCCWHFLPRFGKPVDHSRPSLKPLDCSRPSFVWHHTSCPSFGSLLITGLAPIVVHWPNLSNRCSSVDLNSTVQHVLVTGSCWSVYLNPNEGDEEVERWPLTSVMRTDQGPPKKKKGITWLYGSEYTLGQTKKLPL